MEVDYGGFSWLSSWGVMGLKIVSKMEIEATKESILAALDDYQNEHPNPVSYMFEEFKVIED